MKVFGADTRQAVRETRTTDYESESELGEGAEETPIHTTERNITKKLGGHFAERTMTPSSDSIIPLQSPRGDFQEPRPPKADNRRRSDLNILPESGKNMRYFLRHLQMSYEEAMIPYDRWGAELRKYSTGSAIQYWFYL